MLNHKKVMCRCWSVGLDTEPVDKTKKDTPTLLDPKTFFKGVEFTRLVAIDKCIAHVIKHLWENNIWTENSCCGHGGSYASNPSIVFPNPLTEQDASKIRKLVAEVDNRKFTLWAWQLTEF